MKSSKSSNRNFKKCIVLFLLLSDILCLATPFNRSMRMHVNESRPSDVDNPDDLVSELKNLGINYMRSLKSMENILTDMQDKWRDIDSKSKSLKRNLHLLTNVKPCNNDEDFDEKSEFENEDEQSFSKRKDTQMEVIKKLAAGIKDIWAKLENTSWHVPNSEIPALRSQITRLLFLLKDRHCESATETFYKGHCHPTGQGEHCPHNSLMVLYDGPNNEGICDCQDNISGKNGLLPIFSNKSGKCHFQNTQGPCIRGEWLVIKDGVSHCETVPNKCFDDGKHVYGKLKIKESDITSHSLRGRLKLLSSTESKCWEIDSNGNCPPGQTIKVQQSLDGELRVHCSIHASGIVPVNSLAYFSPCRAATNRNHGNCHRGFFG